MPVPGLREEKESFHVIGKLKKGAEKQPGKPGKDLEYFRPDFVDGEEEAAALFLAEYGAEPDAIGVYLPYPEVERTFVVQMEKHGKTGAHCIGDIEGGIAYAWRNQDGSWERGRKQCPDQVCDGCKETGRLYVIVPGLGRFAAMEVVTHSVHDIRELYQNLLALRSLHGGSLCGFPCVLRRGPKKISVPMDGGKRARVVKSLLWIEPAEQYARARIAQHEQAVAAMIEPVVNAPPAQLPAPAAPPVDAINGEYTEDDDGGEEWDRFSEDVDALGGQGCPSNYREFLGFCARNLAGLPSTRTIEKRIRKACEGRAPANGDGSCAFDPVDMFAALQEQGR